MLPKYMIFFPSPMIRYFNLTPSPETTLVSLTEMELTLKNAPKSLLGKYSVKYC